MKNPHPREGGVSYMKRKQARPPGDCRFREKLRWQDTAACRAIYGRRSAAEIHKISTAVRLASRMGGLHRAWHMVRGARPGKPERQMAGASSRTSGKARP